jgi:hypothetical protein
MIAVILTRAGVWKRLKYLVGWDGIEPPTPGFSPSARASP